MLIFSRQLPFRLVKYNKLTSSRFKTFSTNDPKNAVSNNPELKDENKNWYISGDRSSILQKPHGFWNDRKQQRIFFDEIAEELDITDWKDWYRVSPKEVFKLGGNSILSIYRNSVRNAVMSIYPEHPWEHNRFLQRVSKNYWNDAKNQRRFFDELYKKLNLNSWEDWYDVTYQEIQDNGGTGVLNHFGNSVMKALMFVYPEYSWKMHNFSTKSKIPDYYWKDKKHRREFFDQLWKDLNITSYEGWYNYTEETIKKQTSTQLWNIFGGTHVLSLIETYPEHPFKLHNFPLRFPRNFFSKREHVVQYFEILSKQLDIKHLDDWYNVGMEDFMKNHGNQVLRHHQRSLIKALASVYPDHNWDSTKRFFNGKSQHQLLRAVENLFTPENGDIFVNYLHPDLHYLNSKNPIELDIFIPKLSLALEFQGQQHYESNKLFTFDSNFDVEKLKACEQEGITLIAVPYWWDKTVESLGATISQKRPGLLPLSKTNSKPIPENPPTKIRKKSVVLF